MPDPTEYKTIKSAFDDKIHLFDEHEQGIYAGAYQLSKNACGWRMREPVIVGTRTDLTYINCIKCWGTKPMFELIKKELHELKQALADRDAVLAEAEALGLLEVMRRIHEAAK
jgi:hypothetical protein